MVAYRRNNSFATGPCVMGTHVAFEIFPAQRSGGSMRQLLRRAIRAAKSAAIITTMTVLAACGARDMGYGGGGSGGATAPSALSYTMPATVTVGTAITPLTPT